MKISVRKLKSRLSEILRRVTAGKDVARSLPPRARRGKVSSEAELIERFRRLPGVRPGNGERPALPKPLLRIGNGEKTLAEIVSEQRG